MTNPTYCLNRRHVLTLCAGATGALFAPAVLAGGAGVETLSGYAMGTTWQATIPTGADTAALRAALVENLAHVDRLMSPWKADSDVSRFNATRESCEAHPETREVTRASLDLASRSKGAFDPTVGPIVARWGFGTVRGDAESRWTSLEVDDRQIGKREAGATLDLCGIAKGYALDRMAGAMDRAAIGNYLIDLGGELIGRGQHPSGRAWQIAIDREFAASRSPELIGLRNVAVATSGVAPNGYALGDAYYSHIIDPSAGAPVSDTILSVTVIAPTAMWADGWATALLAAGPKNGPALARTNAITARFILPDTSIDTGDFAQWTV